MWLILALLSAVFAALTSILAKVGIEGVDSNLATAIRTLVVFFMACGMVCITEAKVDLTEISIRTWVFLVLSGLATGASWLCYFKALQLGDVSKVAPIDKTSIIFTIIMAIVFLHEQLTLKVALWWGIHRRRYAHHSPIGCLLPDDSVKRISDFNSMLEILVYCILQDTACRKNSKYLQIN